MANDIKWNGMLLGGAMGGLLAFFIQKSQAVAPATNLANTIWSGMTSLSTKIIGLWSGFASLSTDVVSYAVFIIAGLVIGLYVEYK